MGGREFDLEHPVFCSDEHLELCSGLPDLAGPTLLCEQEDEVPYERIGTLEHIVEDRELRGRIGLSIAEHSPEIVGALERLDELGKLRTDGREAALALRGLVEGARVDAFRDGYERFASNCEKSISERASSIRRFWSSDVSDLPVILSAASTESVATD